MGLFSSIKKLGRAVDPTSRTSPLGGVVRGIASAHPIGQAALTVANVGAAITHPPSSGAPRTDPTARPSGIETERQGAAVALATPPRERAATSPPWYTQPATFIAAGGAVLVLVLALVGGRRK